MLYSLFNLLLTISPLLTLCFQHPETGDLHDLPTPVSKQQIVEINDPVLLTPKQLVILWDPDTEYRYQHRLNVRTERGEGLGGCGLVAVELRVEPYQLRCSKYRM